MLEPGDETLVFQTPLNRRLAVSLSAGIMRSSTWLEQGQRPSNSASKSCSVLGQEIEQQLEAYFAGKLTHFDLPLDFRGTTFEVAVWQTVYRIPFGMMVSYADVARATNRPGAHRGVARAMANLDFSLFVPAHRVIGADGRIKGASPQSMRERLYHFEIDAKHA